MSLIESLNPTPIYVFPATRNMMLVEIRERYFNEIDPEVWKVYFDNDNNDDRFEECIESIFNIVEETINKFVSEGHIAPLPSPQFGYLRDSLWEESQSFWHEYSKDLTSILNIADRMHKVAQKEINELFPEAERIFGSMATSLLIDLSFQYEFYRYSKLAKPDLIDLRRMVNVCGQIVESVFYAKLFPEEPLAFGQIFNKLKILKNPDSVESISFLSRFKNGNLIIKEEFRSSLSVLMEKRNKYSHGWSECADIEDDFRQCVNALLGKSSSVLTILYDILNNAAA
jgi:hypothetical protein